MENKKIATYILILSFLLSYFVLFTNISMVKAQDLPYPPETPPPDKYGILSNPPYIGVEQYLPWEVDYDYMGQVCEGINVLLDPTDWANIPYLDETNSWLDEEYYVVEEIDPLKYREIITFVPMFLIETEEWYSHEFEFTTTTIKSTEISTEIGIGIRKGQDKVTFAAGTSTLIIDEFVSGWSETVPAGETWVIYVKMRFLWVYGTLKFLIHIPTLTPQEYEDLVEWDCIFLQNVFWDNVYPVKYNSRDIPLEKPFCQASLYEPESWAYLQENFYREWTHIEEYTSSISFDLQAVTAKEEWAGIYLGFETKHVSTETNEFCFKHTFYRELDNTDNLYYDIFHLRYDNTYSVNIESNRLPTITFLSPNPGDQVSGTTRFRVLVNDDGDDPIKINLRVWLSTDNIQDLNDMVIGNLRRKPHTFEWYWDIVTWQIDDGQYYIIILAEDEFGDTKWHDTTYFYFYNDDTDNTPSTGEILTPSNGDNKLLGDDIYFSAIAFDDAEGVYSVQFRVGIYGTWYNAMYNSLYQCWQWWWYDQPGIGSYTVYCRVTDDEGNQVIVDSVRFNIIYGTLETYRVRPVTYSYYWGGTTHGKYDDNIYYKVRTTGSIYWPYWNWKSVTDFYFRYIPQCISASVELQITPCTSDVKLYVYYVEGGSSIFYPKENTYSTQTFYTISGKHIYRVRIEHSTWWCTYKWLYIDFIRVRYRVT
jgi:hypothetical protein